MKFSVGLTIAASLLLPIAQSWPVSNGTSSEFLGSIQYACGDDVENWVINVGFGTPEQVLPLTIDTASDKSFVNGVLCETDFCLNQKRFNAGKSTSITDLHETETLVFETGQSVVGNVYEDNLNFAGSVQLENFDFIKAYATSGFKPSNFAGVFGFGVPASHLDSSLRKRGSANARGNSYYSGDSAQYSSSRGNGRKRNNNGIVCQLDFGIDTTQFSGDVAWLDIPTCDYGDSPFWKTELIGAHFGTVIELSLQNTLASFDTSVKNLAIPQDDLSAIYEGLNATQCDDGTYEFKCCKAPDMTLSFAKYDVTIPSEYWTSQKDSSGEWCTAKLELNTATDAPANRWRLGTSFTVLFYTIFSPSRGATGLARSITGSPEALIIKATA